MNMKPNKTVIEGVVRAIHPASGGIGHEVEVQVDANLSSKGEDFIQPSKGDVLSLYATEPPATQVGQKVVAHARLLGGPGMERMVLESVSPHH